MGLGLSLFPGWSASIPAPTVNPAGLPILQDSTGDLTTESDAGLPAGVQSVNIAGNINRDQVIDVRTTRPVGFITTYPLDITMDMEVYQVPQVYDLTTNAGPQPPTNPGASEWTYLTDLLVATSAYNPTAPDPTQVYAHITGLRKQTEGESVSVGRYLAYTIRFLGADIMMPIAAMPSPGSAT
jgi:hypothetical protein